jgi:sugar lactone lactonase YvrE
VDSAGNLVIADTYNNVVRVVAASTGTFYGQAMTAGDIYTVAGTGTAGYAGDGAPATSARLKAPDGVATDSAGNLVIADSGNNRVRVVAASTGTFYGQGMTAGDIYTVAGTGTAGYAGDGGPASAAALRYPQGVTADSAGNLIIADTGNSAVRVIAASTATFYGQAMTAGDIYTVAGTGTAGYAGDGGPAASADLSVPPSVAVDSAGNLIIADYGNDAVRVVAASTATFYGQAMTAGDIYTVAGTGTAGFSGDGGPASSTELYYPQSVAADSAGDLLIADAGNNRVRMVAGGTGETAARTSAKAGKAGEAGKAERRAIVAGPAEDPSMAGPFVTLLFSRTEITAADNCVPDDNGVARLDTVVAPYLQTLGLTGTGSIETGVTRETGRFCTHFNDSLGASWADEGSLARNYHWSFVDHTATYPSSLGTLPATQSYAETCGSAATIDAHGLPGANGLIAYPGSQAAPVPLQTEYGASCFAWGRRFNSSGTTSYEAASTPPYWQATAGVNGGACNDPTAACYTMATRGGKRYALPSTIISEIQALQPGQWFTLQAYLLVTGTNPAYRSNGTQWDCTSPDPAEHWTNDTERYCWSDYQAIVSAIAAMPTITVTDPLTVGAAFGRPTEYPTPAAGGDPRR